ncbi:MAG: exosortase/archaeosortase family protein [Armatimonadota bacterium]|nr:exosortase/archaeosortase family protein [Armatimonadota bacterium]
METDISTIRKAPATMVALRNDYAWLVMVGLGLAMMIAAYGRLMTGWWDIWWAENSRYSHGILVPFISAFIIYSDRQRLAEAKIQPNLAWGIPALLITMGMQVVFRTIKIPSMENLSFPVLLVMSSFLLLGFKPTKILLFPLLFLLFMVPLPGSVLTKIEFQVQLWSTICATKMLHIMQFDVARTGVFMHMSNVTVQVAQACSGFRMLISLFAFSTFFAHMKEGSAQGRVGLVLSALPLGLVANSMRIMFVALVGEFFGEDAMHAFHDYSGYLMLGVSFVVLELISRSMGCARFRTGDEMPIRYLLRKVTFRLLAVLFAVLTWQLYENGITEDFVMLIGSVCVVASAVGLGPELITRLIQCRNPKPAQ